MLSTCRGVKSCLTLKAVGVNSREDVSRGQGVDKDTEGMCGRHKAAPPCDTTTLLHSYRGLCASCPRPAPSWPVSAGSPQALAPNHLSSCCVLCCLISSPLSLASSSLAAAGCQEIQKREVAAVAHSSGKAGGGDCFSEGPRAQAHLPCVGMEAGAKLTMQPCYDLLRPDVRGGGMGRIY